jgi:hypothetical protein
MNDEITEQKLETGSLFSNKTSESNELNYNLMTSLINNATKDIDYLPAINSVEELTASGVSFIDLKGNLTGAVNGFIDWTIDNAGNVISKVNGAILGTITDAGLQLVDGVGAVFEKVTDSTKNSLTPLLIGVMLVLAFLFLRGHNDSSN